MPKFTINETIGLIEALDDSILLRWLIQAGELKSEFPELIPPPSGMDIREALEFRELLDLSARVLQEKSASKKKDDGAP